MKKKRGDEGPDDLELWRRVASTVRPLKAPKTPAAAAKPEKKERISPPRAPLPVPSPVPVHPARGLDGATERRLKRGQMEIEGRIDLHGKTQAEAFDALVRYIGNARRRGLRTVLVITGKGKAPGSGVLRRLLPQWLESPELRGVVVGCTQAKPKDGGEGAFYVRLKNPGR